MLPFCRRPRSPSDRNDSLSDSDEDYDGSLSEDYDDDLPDADGGESDEGSDEQQKRKRLPSRGGKAHKAFMVAKEIKDSERVFVDVLKLLNVVSTPHHWVLEGCSWSDYIIDPASLQPLQYKVLSDKPWKHNYKQVWSTDTQCFKVFLYKHSDCYVWELRLYKKIPVNHNLM